MKDFRKLPLASAVMCALVVLPVSAETEVQNAVDLDTVVVKGDRQGMKVKTNVVTTKKKDESVETDLRGLFKDEPAISIGAGNGTSQYLYIRGMGQNSVDVKVDNGYADSQFLYHQGRHMLDPALVKIVSVQKGAGSASAGIGQTNGAVVAKTLDAEDLLKNSSNPNFGARLNAGYNSNDGHNYGAAVFGKAGGVFDYLIAGNRVNEDEYKGGKGYTNGYNGSDRVPYSKLDKTGYLGKIGLNINEDHRVALNHRYEQHKGERLVREEFSVGGRLSLDRQAPAMRKMTVNHTNLEWTGKNLGFAQSANANIYRLEQGRWSADDSGNGYAGGRQNTGATKTKLDTIGANVNFDSRVHDKVILKYGVNFRNQEVKPNRVFLSGVRNQEKQDIGMYGEAIADIKDVTLTAGLRYDYFNFKAMDGKKISDGAVNPSVGVIWQAMPNLSFSASHNYATRSPRMHDALLSHGTRGVVSIADGTKAEQARNTEIGFNYNDSTFGLEGSYFWQNIKDALGTTTGRNNHLCTGANLQCFSEIVNAGRVKNKGYELGASYRYEGLTARLGVAHAKPRFYGEGLSANGEYAAAIGRTWTASLGYRFNKPNLEVAVHRRQVEKVKAKDNFFLSNNTVKAADKGKASYGVTDITANWKPLDNDKMNVNFAVNNITNKNYVPHAQRSDLPGTGREYRIGMNYTF
ncbi:TonB-dependent receptor domain-containing protein [Neisseria weixii]|uniref:TonB-dependent receptor n=1 Tax=Neisseria weixii TaxID=1853276 RepID=A0A3N4MTW2_9NEIS|nr:TonB-dependent receptor [Neisseria weixii]RPD86995.1 TonB-dependent receptor [Neisseria weixii]RPD87151.1 TonB-dependent receptor [Neisseria weixii]